MAEIANDMRANGFDKSRPIIVTDGEYFAAFLKLDEIRRSSPNAQGSSDEAIGRQLNKSARQVCKMREIAKKADVALLEKIQNGSVSINKAHEMIKAAEAKKKAGIVEEAADEKSSNTGKGINSDSFKLGVLFVLSELEKSRKKSQIMKDKRIAKLELGELKLYDEDVARISQRFGIA